MKLKVDDCTTRCFDGVDPQARRAGSKLNTLGKSYEVHGMAQTVIIGATSRFGALRRTAPGIFWPYLTTGVDGVNLNTWTKLNGQFEQQGNTNV